MFLTLWVLSTLMLKFSGLIKLVVVLLFSFSVFPALAFVLRFIPSMKRNLPRNEYLQTPAFRAALLARIGSRFLSPTFHIAALILDLDLVPVNYEAKSFYQIIENETELILSSRVSSSFDGSLFE